MEGPQHMPAERAPPVLALPKSAILSYFNVQTATRVRTIAVWGLYLSGALVWLEMAWLLNMVVGFSTIQTLDDLLYMIEGLLREDLFFSLILAALFVNGLLLVLCGVGLKRAYPAAAVVGIMALMPALVVTLLMTVGFLIGAFLEGLGVGSGKTRPAYLFYLIPGILGVPAILLLKDLIAFQVWIFKNPGAEKPPVPFLPGPSRLP